MAARAAASGWQGDVADPQNGVVFQSTPRTRAIQVADWLKLPDRLSYGMNLLVRSPPSRLLGKPRLSNDPVAAPHLVDAHKLQI